MNAPLKTTPIIDLIAQRGGGFAYFLRRLRVVPKIRRADLFF
jgi:hypothetical protein